MNALKKLLTAALIFFACTSTSFAQETSSDSLLKSNIERWFGKKMNIDYETGSAFTLIHFKTKNGKVEIVAYRSSNPKVQKALEEALHKNPFELNLQLTEDKDYLTTIINIALDDGSEPVHFGKGTNQELLYFNALKLPQNTIALSPIVWMYFKPNHIRKTEQD